MTSMKIETSELQGAALDWAVAKCEITEHIEEFDYFFLKNYDNGFCYYSASWALGGPIIEREKIALCPGYSWEASKDFDAVGGDTDTAVEHGPTPLIAAMRCYVASKLGDTVEIPEKLS